MLTRTVAASACLGLPFFALPIAVLAMPSSPDLGKAEGQCRKGEGGPAVLCPLGLRCMVYGRSGRHVA